MESYVLEPEVAGGLGDRTIMDRSVHPPIVNHLHYRFERWVGDVLLEGSPAFIVTADAKRALVEMGASGAKFDDVEIATTDAFEELYPDRELPAFAWLKPEGKEAGQDDVGIASDGRLVVSRRTLDTLNALGISHALIEPFGGEAR